MELLLLIVVGLVVLLIPVAGIVILVVVLSRRSRPAGDPRAQQAADPTTPAAVLATLATEVPQLRATIAANPSAYPGLLEWLGQLGDPAVDAVLRARGL